MRMTESPVQTTVLHSPRSIELGAIEDAIVDAACFWDVNDLEHPLESKASNHASK